MTPTARGAIATAAIAGGAAVAHVLPDSGPTICPFALGTGVACPLCGLTRSTLMLFRGDVASSLAFHPLTIPIVLVLLAVWLWPTARWAEATMAKAAGVTAALVVVWGVRLAAGTLPPI
ncbi:MAG: DUF2752 domain-containing protein [Acidimicrobiia bacterium]|nr:DUF2752 domain-containing protein [Acidimicrobiia bacterium]